MSAAPGCEFPNPCPVCGSTDEHAEFRARSAGMGCTFCPHPSERGHGTGCCCAGRSKPLHAYSLTELGFPATQPTLEQRVAALEAAVDRLLSPVGIVSAPETDLTPEQIAELQKALDEYAAHPVRHFEHRVLPSPPNLLDPETIRQLLRESVTVIKPGEVLFYTYGDPNGTPSQIRELQDWINDWLEYNAPEIKALVLPHGSVAAAEPGGEDALVRLIERVMPEVLRREMRRQSANLPLRT